MGRIEVDEDRCKGCEICVSACPKKVITLANRYNRLGYRTATLREHEPHASASAGKHPFLPWRDHPLHEDVAECNGCGICARMCPDVAITVFKHRIEGDRQQGGSDGK
ncbi:MAG: ferredoxin family protein [Chloroflexi bacterium]|nr:ferredoxin family protein [Chloroflexota bacterium]MDA8188196.1 ferredoxin family protein [Dehalococcoidales bacterium]